MVSLKCLENVLEVARNLRNVLSLLWWKLVEVLVDRSVWLDAVLDTVEASHQHRSECEVRVARGVRSAELDALCLRVGSGHRDADSSRTVTGRVDQVHWSLEAWDQAVVGVDGWVGECEQAWSVLQDSTDVPAS